MRNCKAFFLKSKIQYLLILTGIYSYAQTEVVKDAPNTPFSQTKSITETTNYNTTKKDTVRSYNTATFFVHNPKEFYIQKETTFYISETANLILETEQENSKNILLKNNKTKVNKNTIQEVIITKSKETHYKKQAPRLQEIPANNSQNYASSLGIANKLATSQPVAKTKTTSIGKQAHTTYTTWVNTLPNHTKNNYYNNPTLGKYLQNKTPLYNKPPPYC